ncbi:lipoprotein [Streptomyces sp. 7R007]
MPVGAGNLRRSLVHAAVLAGVLTGCADTAEDQSKPGAGAATSASAGSGATAAKSGGRIGGAASQCALPVTFAIAEGWKANAVDAGTAGETSGSSDGDLAGEVADALLRQGPVTAVCEVDAKPAGHLGYLRVFTGDPGEGDARAVLEAFVAAEDGASKAAYHTFRTGGVSGVEVTYLYSSEFLDESKEESAFAVTTGRGPVVVHLGGFDTEEHKEMLPAFELAKTTLRLD